MKAKPRELLEKEAKLLEYYNDVVHYLRAFNIDENLLEDAIQDTFVEALSSLDTLRDETKMKYWLIKIAKRVGSKYVTKCKNVAIRECSFDEYVLQSRCDIETFCDKDFDTFISGLEREDLYKYISRLRPNEQKALLLYYVYGHKLNEIAEVLGETSSNVRSLSRRAKLKLRKMFLPILIPLLLDSEHLIIHKAATAKGLLALFLLNFVRIYRIYDCSIRHSILPSFACLKSVLSLY